MATKTISQLVLRCIFVVVFLKSSMAAYLPESVKWLESNDPNWLINKKTTNNIHSFSLRVKEGQSVIDENIQVDTNRQTERFHIQAFDSVDEAIILSDFTKNWTMIKLPNKNQCFLQNLNPVTPPPQQLVNNIKKAIALNGSSQTIDIDINEKTSWKVSRVLFNRVLLTPEMKKLCQNAPVYEIYRSGGQVYVQGLKRQGRSQDDSSKVEIRSACGGKICCYYWKWYCKTLTSSGCLWVKVKVYGCQAIVC